MLSYEIEISIVEEIGDPLSPLPDDRISKLKNDFSLIPRDYLDFLKEVGSGSIGCGRMQIYDGLVYPDEFYDPDTAEELDEVFFFGDDFQGHGYGFLTKKSWEIVGFDPTFRELTILNPTFKNFISKRLHQLKETINS